MLLLPTRLAQMAMLGAGAVSGGFVSRAVSYAAGSQLRDVARQHLPGWAGGHGGAERSALAGRPTRGSARGCAPRACSPPARPRAPAARRRRGRRPRARRVPRRPRAAGATARHGGSNGSGEPAGRAGCGECGAERTRARTRRRRWPAARTRWRPAVACSGRAGARRTSTPRCSRRRCASSTSRSRPSRPGRRSTRSRPRPRAAVRSLVADHGPRARQHLAYQALGEWTPEQREAIRTLAAASPEVRAQAFADGGGSTAGFGESAEPSRRRDRGRAPRRRSRRPRPPARPANGGQRRRRSRAPQDQPPPGRWGRRVNPAPAHLEAKLRFGWDFTVGQIAAMVGGILVGFAWANWLSPIHGIGAAVTGVYVGGLPVAAGFVASQTEFDLWAVVLSALRWRRAEGRFVAGAGRVHRLRRRSRARRAAAATASRSRCSTPSCCGARRDRSALDERLVASGVAAMIDVSKPGASSCARRASCSASRRSTAPAWWSRARARSCGSSGCRR